MKAKRKPGRMSRRSESGTRGGGPHAGEGGMTLPGTVRMEVKKNSCVIRFQKPHNVLSTSWLNGGYRTDLTAVFNNRISRKACDACHAGAGIREYLKGVARGLRLSGKTATGLVTRAEMKHTSVVTESFRDLAVCAIVTAGVDKNGGRAGDPASYYENAGSFEPVGGTINTILLIGASLPEHVMARAMMTATEAKAAALQQLVARSLYSSGIATGSGTDMMAIVSDPSSPLQLTDAGKHAKLGELIAKAVIRATHSALELETGLSAESQRDVLVRLERYHVKKEDIWNAAAASAGTDPSDRKTRQRFFRYLAEWAKDPGEVALVAAAIHVIDEAAWGLVPDADACGGVCHILQGDTLAGGIACGSAEPLACVTALVAARISRGFRRNDGQRPVGTRNRHRKRTNGTEA